MNGYAFTESLRTSLAAATEEAHRLKHEYVGTEHILLGLTRGGSGTFMSVLKQAGGDPGRIRDTIETTVRPGEAKTDRPQLPYTTRTKHVFELAMEEARSIGHEYIGCEHLLLGLIREGRGIAAQVLSMNGVTHEATRAAVIEQLGRPDTSTLRPPPPPRPARASDYDAVDEIGLLYDTLPLYAARGDVAFYLAEVERVGRQSKVVELGCGTGRVLIPIARAGHSIVGVDSSVAMLRRCHENLGREPEEVRKRVTLLHADVSTLGVLPRNPGDVDVAIAPFRVLQHLTQMDQQMFALTALRARLRHGGRFVFDVFNPNVAAMLQDRSAEQEDTPELQLPDGRFLRRTARVLKVHWLDQVSDIELIYYVRTGDTTQRQVHAFAMRWYTVRELEHLLARTGFQVEQMFGGVDRQPLADGSPDIVVVARAA